MWNKIDRNIKGSELEYEENICVPQIDINIYPNVSLIKEKGILQDPNPSLATCTILICSTFCNNRKAGNTLANIQTL